VFKPAVILIGAALFAAGCASTPTEPAPEEIISLPQVTANGPASLDWKDTNFVVSLPAPHPSQPAARPAPRPRPAAPMTIWTSLNRWAAENNISKPSLLSRAPTASYAVKSANGTLVLDIGSREASWKGTAIHLGFAPEFIDDQVFVHGLDLQKNIEPLLSEPPVTFQHRVVVIDPGHGGKEFGARSIFNNHYEKEFTLDWALRIVPLLTANGWQVFLTRTGDTDVALSNRVAIAESHHADLFISLHFNSAAPDEKAAGVETYCLTPPGMPSTLTRGYPDILTQSYPNNAYNDESLGVAVRLQTALAHGAGLEDRGVCRARFIGVLRGQNRPAVLIEGGYLSNIREARQIEKSEFRQKLAQAVADALR